MVNVFVLLELELTIRVSVLIAQLYKQVLVLEIIVQLAQLAKKE